LLVNLFKVNKPATKDSAISLDSTTLFGPNVKIGIEIDADIPNKANVIKGQDPSINDFSSCGAVELALEAVLAIAFHSGLTVLT